MSDNSVRSALYSLGFGTAQNWHVFCGSARTMLVDQLDLDPLAIEANLAHAVKDANGRSYNRTKYLAKRFHQIQKWADCLGHLAPTVFRSHAACAPASSCPSRANPDARWPVKLTY